MLNKTLKFSLFALTTALGLSACGGGGTTPIVSPPPVITPPPAATVNPPISLNVKELTLHAGESASLITNIGIDGLYILNVGSGLSETDTPTKIVLTAAATAGTFDTWVVVGGLTDPSNWKSSRTYAWVKVHVIGSTPAPWMHSDALKGTAGSVETEFVRLLNAVRAQGGTCVDNVEHTRAPKNFPPALALTLNQRASAGLRMKAEDAILRSWYTHDSPEGLGFGDFILQAGTTGFFNEALETGAHNDAATPTENAQSILNAFLYSYDHCEIMLGSDARTDGPLQIAVGWYTGYDSRLQEEREVMPVSFSDDSTILREPILNLD
ncbi:CAP domain-containing protein [Deinococcus ruber]|uniref:SCP domain-containing protein n=1 Tax=Deinococcus ruber TaxID=1848197 RepID=A0A918F584_9DEIO|nr:hypothetical protein [Deinococcus ruber]GGR09984.1 hypothetical protein GCM10008957_23450 [Deinococcus ruber]